MESTQVKYIFFHIPKTGGTTFRIHLQDKLIDQLEFIHLANKGNKWAEKMNKPAFHLRSIEDRNKAKVILGHLVDYETKSLFLEKIIHEIVFFRDPFDWEISRYNQMMNRRVKHNKPIIPFLKWFNQVEKIHSQFDWFLAKYLKIGPNIHQLNKQTKKHILFSTLYQFKYVCFLEQIESFSKMLYKKLGVTGLAKPKNVVGKDKVNYFEESKENLDVLKYHCQFENKLYNKIRNTFGQNFKL